MPECRLILGDCVEVMRKLPEASIDACVCDPPYGLEFMGKEWDAPWKGKGIVDAVDWNQGESNAYSRSRVRSGRSASYGTDGAATGAAFQAWCEVWAREVLRVLKPGGHLLAFGGTRTYHRLACAIEDAGFEIRDSVLYWGYGSGFPKSLNVGQGRGTALKPAHEVVVHGLKPEGGSDTIGSCLSKLSASFVAASSSSSQSAFVGVFASALKSAGLPNATRVGSSAVTGMSRYESDLLLSLSTVSSWQRLWVEVLAPMSMSITGMGTKPIIDLKTLSFSLLEITRAGTISVQGSELLSRVKTAVSLFSVAQARSGCIPELAATENATSRLPIDSLEGAEPLDTNIVLARKPLIGTVAANVLKHGTGAINIDGCRVGYQSDADHEKATRSGHSRAHDGFDGTFAIRDRRGEPCAAEKHPEGRWPANVILDEEAGALLDEQTGVLKSGPSYVRSASVHSENVEFNPKNAGTQQVGFGDSGGASRFFYCAKVSKSERGEGNNHPTLKPIALMRYLARLVTPPGATVLDPFMGSGSTGLACQAEGFDFIGIEREAAYMEIARRRLGMRLEDDPMFG